jgi:hypothetical protein
VAVLLDITSENSLEEITEAIARADPTAKANRNILIVLRPPTDKKASSTLVPLLCRALTYDGAAADSDADGVIRLQELEAFLRKEPSDAQIAAIPSSSDAFLFLQQAANLDDVIEDFGDQLASVLQEHGVSAAVIPDFREEQQSDREVCSGPLGAFLAERIRRHVGRASEDTILVAGSRSKLDANHSNVAGIDAVFQLDLKPPTDPPSFVALSGTVAIAKNGVPGNAVPLRMIRGPLTIDEVGMSGHVNMSPKSAVAAGIRWTIEDLDAPPAKAPHPMADAEFPLRVSLTSPEGKPYETTFSDDKRRMHVKIAKGDKYAIQIENKTGQDLFLRLLVDGRNTLPDRTADGDAFEPASFVNLTRARCWFCEKGRTYRVDGFYTQAGEKGAASDEGRWKAFCVADVGDVLPQGEQREQLGIITAAFYQAVEKENSPMASQPEFATRMGSEGTGKVEVYAGDSGPGALIGDSPINIHYGFQDNGDH